MDEPPPFDAPEAASTEEPLPFDAPEAVEGDPSSPSGVWSKVFGSALSSPGAQKRNKRLSQLTPGKSHLGEEATQWLARHQEAARGKLERRFETRRRRAELGSCGEGGSGTATPRATSPVPLQPLETGSWGPARQPPGVEVGQPPQILVLEMEGLLVERFRRSMWSGTPTVYGRPGVVSGLQQLRRRFLLCAICRSPCDVAERVLSELGSRGLRFDLAYAVPPSSSRHLASPCLTTAAKAQICSDTGTSPDAFRRRALLVVSLELEHAEIESRMLEARTSHGGEPATAMRDAAAPLRANAAAARGSKLLCSPTKRRHHVRMLMHDVPTILVPHPRLQVDEQAVIMSELVRRIEALHAAGPTDWVAAHEASPDTDELFRKSYEPPNFELEPATAPAAAVTARPTIVSVASSPRLPTPTLPWRFLVLTGRAAALAPYEQWAAVDPAEEPDMPSITAGAGNVPQPPTKGRRAASAAAPQTQTALSTPRLQAGAAGGSARRAPQSGRRASTTPAPPRVR